MAAGVAGATAGHAAPASDHFTYVAGDGSWIFTDGVLAANDTPAGRLAPHGYLSFTVRDGEFSVAVHDAAASRGASVPAWLTLEVGRRYHHRLVCLPVGRTKTFSVPRSNWAQIELQNAASPFAGGCTVPATSGTVDVQR